MADFDDFTRAEGKSELIHRSTSFPASPEIRAVLLPTLGLTKCVCQMIVATIAATDLPLHVEIEKREIEAARPTVATERELQPYTISSTGWLMFF